MRSLKISERFSTPDPEMKIVSVVRQGETCATEIEAPVAWSENAARTFASHYLRVVDGRRETSVLEAVTRLCDTISQWGLDDGYFDIDNARMFSSELRALLLAQRLTFNSPVWYNMGVTENPQISACYIQGLEDSMEALIALQASETRLFRRGSGTGTNLSNLRPLNWPLSGGGSSSGPVSFMRGFDSWAGVTKSGGKTRRAAKMLILEAWHPDIFDFVNFKAEAEKMADALVAAGWPADWNGVVGAWLPFQNGNNSVRASDAFMRAVGADRSWDLRWNGEVIRTIRARELWHQICAAAAECGCPGLQFDDAINEWHPTPSAGRQRASNPCSEYMYIDDSACNLAHLNLLKFNGLGRFDDEAMAEAARLSIIAQDILVDRASYPTPAIDANSRRYRPLGLGYAGLGALLMSRGLGYDSQDGRSAAAAITSLLGSAAWAASTELAMLRGSYLGSNTDDRQATRRCLTRHAGASMTVRTSHFLASAAERSKRLWDLAVGWFDQHGVRNAQLTLLAPTGTCGIAMDCGSTGCEPYFAPVTYKTLAGGGTMKLPVDAANDALVSLGYSDAEREKILGHVAEFERFDDAPGLRQEHMHVFDCAVSGKGGTRCLSAKAHVDMMIAIQPFLSGAISKTVNMPASSTAEDVGSVYMHAWKGGLKAIAVYVDGSKFSQPISTGTSAEARRPKKIVEAAKPEAGLQRSRLPRDREAVTRHFEIGGVDGYITVGFYEDGRVGEVFARMGKLGDTINGLLDSWAIIFSTSLQHGVPLEVLINKGKGSDFAPHGFTGDDLRSARSVIDYACRFLQRFLENGDPEPTAQSETKHDLPSRHFSIGGPPCSAGTGCPGTMAQRGPCIQCDVCGHRSGCSG